MKVVDLTLAYAQDPCTALDLLSTLEDDEVCYYILKLLMLK